LSNRRGARGGVKRRGGGVSLRRPGLSRHPQRRAALRGLQAHRRGHWAQLVGSVRIAQSGSGPEQGYSCHTNDLRRPGWEDLQRGDALSARGVSERLALQGGCLAAQGRSGPGTAHPLPGALLPGALRVLLRRRPPGKRLSEDEIRRIIREELRAREAEEEQTIRLARELGYAEGVRAALEAVRRYEQCNLRRRPAHFLIRLMRYEAMGLRTWEIRRLLKCSKDAVRRGRKVLRELGVTPEMAQLPLFQKTKPHLEAKDASC